MTFTSLFAGIEGFGLGLENAGHKCVARVEKDKTCQSVLRRHWPDSPLFDCVKDFHAGSIAVRPDLICGGFPCQDLSVAGKRLGLAGKRSGLFFEFMRIVAEFSPAWVLIENVPGLLSSNRGRDMGTVLWTLGQLGYGWAYRVLDAQWLGLAQRRKRVFIVGCLGNVRRAAEILFERESVPWHSPSRRQAGQRVAPCVRGGTESGSNEHGNKIEALQDAGNSHWREGQPTLANSDDNGTNQLVTHTLKSEGADASEDGTGRGVPLVPYTVSSANSCEKQSHGRETDVARSLDQHGGFASGQGGTVAIAYRTAGNCGPFEQGDKTAALNTNTDPSQYIVAFSQNQDGYVKEGAVVNAMGTEQNHASARTCAKVKTSSGVRRLAPRECERLQGFPDDWTRWDHDGKEISDSARYRMLGNAVAVPCAEWIGRRLMECKP